VSHGLKIVSTQDEQLRVIEKKLDAVIELLMALREVFFEAAKDAGAIEDRD